VARFWWGGDDMKRKIYWRKWKDIAIPKNEGGMGFSDFQLFNQVMLAKQGWRLIMKPDSLCAKVLKGKYFHDTYFMDAKRKRNALHTWNTILYGRVALKKGLIKRVGDGSSINVWEDPWILVNRSMKPMFRDPEAKVTKVHELIDNELGCCDAEKVEENFISVDASAICSIPIGRFSEDNWAWNHEKNGIFR
jgi:hypothetical protein